jgi:hypothetical protein
MHPREIQKSHQTLPPPVHNGFTSSGGEIHQDAIRPATSEDNIRNYDSTQISQTTGSRRSSLGIRNSQSHDSDYKDSPTVVQVQGVANPHNLISTLPNQVHPSHDLAVSQSQEHNFGRDSRSQMMHHTVENSHIRTHPVGDTAYSSIQALSQLRNKEHNGYMENEYVASIRQQEHQNLKHIYHNESVDAAFSPTAAAAPKFHDGQDPIEGFYPPPQNYSHEAIQFHRDRIYEQARPSLNSILRSSPGLIPPASEALRVRPATYYSSKSPPVPLLTRPNSPGPKGFTPVRVKPFNPQGVISPMQGFAPAGSSSAYAKFLLARSEYKPESLHHSP